MRELFEALQDLGVNFEYLGKEGCLPVRYCNGATLPLPSGEGWGEGNGSTNKPPASFANRFTHRREYNNHVVLQGNVSSQFFTALLLIAPVLPQGLEIEVVGEQVSKSYIDMTVGILRDFGVQVENHNYQKYVVPAGQKYQPKKYEIEGDASGCSYFWGIAAVTGQSIRVTNINPESVQGDVGFADILEKMGGRVVKNFAERWIEVQGPENLSDLRGVEVDMENMPDTAQTLAVVAAFAQGSTRITGLSTLKGKETDRLLATKTELGKMGIEVRVGDDWMEVDGGNPRGAEIETYHDHRMAMSFAVAGSKISGVIIQNPNVVSKSFPDFWERLEMLGIKSNIG
jgi:3-phosphoshikimate 1-carboxyvinyltransferase